MFLNNVPLFSILIMFLNLHLLGTAISDEFKIYGPGWDTPHLIFPSRYFFVLQFGTKTVTKAEIIERDAHKLGGGCRIWTQLFNETNFEGRMLIIRYKLLNEQCSNGISIKLYNENNEVIATKEESQPIYSEECACQSNNWYQSMNCDANSELYTQLYSDLKPFNNSKFDFEDSLNEMKRRYAPHPRSYSFCHYVIVNQAIHRKCYGEYVGFAQFMDEILISLIKKVPIPNTQFLVNLGDWPLSDRKSNIKMPVFSWCGSDDTFDIVLPTYELTLSVLNMQGRVSLDILSAFGKQKTPAFEDKTSKLFWRGRDSNKLRLRLIELSKKYPKLIDAAFTNFFFFRDQIDKYGPTVPHSNFFDFFNHKYQLNVDGTVAAYRMPMLLAGTSLVLKPPSKYYEHFYHLLNNGVHYVEVDQNLDDLLPIVKHLIKGKGYTGGKQLPASLEAQQSIVHNARSFVMKHLLPLNVYCYYYKALIEYSSLLKHDVNVINGMDVVYNADEVKCKCVKPEKDEL